MKKGLYCILALLLLVTLSAAACANTGAKTGAVTDAGNATQTS